jgi:hypothetical protein
MMQQQQMGYQQSNMGNFMGMGGMGKPDSLFGAQLMMQQPQMGMPLGIGGMGGMGGMGGLGMGMQQQFISNSHISSSPSTKPLDKAKTDDFPECPRLQATDGTFDKLTILYN